MKNDLQFLERLHALRRNLKGTLQALHRAAAMIDSEIDVRTIKETGDAPALGDEADDIMGGELNLAPDVAIAYARGKLEHVAYVVKFDAAKLADCCEQLAEYPNETGHALFREMSKVAEFNKTILALMESK